MWCTRCESLSTATLENRDLMSSQNLIEVQRLLRISGLAEVLEQSLDLGLCPSLDLVVNMPIAILFILLLKLDM